MRSFSDVQSDARLAMLNVTPLGSLYVKLNEMGLPLAVIRHFNKDAPPLLIEAYVDLLQEMRQWIERKPGLCHWVKIEEPLEIGTDYVVLPFHVYTTSTRSYVQQENPPEVPEELDKMRNAFRRVIGRSKDAKEIVIEGILARSLLKPNGKTYLAADGGPFIVVEPQLKPEDVRQWAALDKPSAIS